MADLSSILPYVLCRLRKLLAVQMKGQNILILNQATMKEAMQLYVEHLFENTDQEVEHVEHDGFADTFSVKLKTREAPPLQDRACL